MSVKSECMFKSIMWGRGIGLSLHILGIKAILKVPHKPNPLNDSVKYLKVGLCSMLGRKRSALWHCLFDHCLPCCYQNWHATVNRILSCTGLYCMWANSCPAHVLSILWFWQKCNEYNLVFQCLVPCLRHNPKLMKY